MDTLPLDVVARCGYRIDFAAKPSGYLQHLQEKGSGFLSARDSLGLTLSREGRVTTVNPGTSADRAGVLSGMQILGINGWRFDSKRFLEAIDESKTITKGSELLQSSPRRRRKDPEPGPGVLGGTQIHGARPRPRPARRARRDPQAPLQARQRKARKAWKSWTRDMQVVAAPSSLPAFTVTRLPKSATAGRVTPDDLKICGAKKDQRDFDWDAHPCRSRRRVQRTPQRRTGRLSIRFPISSADLPGCLGPGSRGIARGRSESRSPHNRRRTTAIFRSYSSRDWTPAWSWGRDDLIKGRQRSLSFPTCFRSATGGEGGHASYARAAPVAPEVEDHNLSPEVGQRDQQATSVEGPVRPPDLQALSLHA